jgi:hypothetical protein
MKDAQRAGDGKGEAERERGAERGDGCKCGLHQDSSMQIQHGNTALGFLHANTACIA